MLNKNDFTPLYIQLYRMLREQILTEEYQNGEKIPSEMELMKTFQTTRGTVRNAISMLVNEGLVEQVQGKGTFVRLKELQYSIFNFGGFTDYLKNRNEIAVSKVLDTQHVEIKGELYYKLVRARGVKKENTTTFLTIDTSLLPLRLFPNIEEYNFENASLYGVLREKYQIFPKYTEITLLPVAVEQETKDILHLKGKEVTLLKAEGSIYAENHTEIEKVSVIYSPKIEFNIMTSIADDNS